MRQAVFAGSGKVEWREAAQPAIRASSEAIVRPLVVGRCDLDVAFVRGLLPLQHGEPIGHEVIAEVLEVGDQTTAEPGDIVFVSAQVSCGRCRKCLSGATGRCSRVPLGASFGMGRAGNFGGALAEAMLIPFADAMLTPVPAGAPLPGLIGLADMAGDAWRGIGPALLREPGASVLVLGGMPPVIGLFAAGLARALGAGAVAYADNCPQRSRIAQDYGAVPIAPDAIGDGAFDVVFVAHPQRQSLETAFRAVAPGGHITSASPTLDGAPSLDTPVLYHKGVTWTIGRPDCAAAQRGLLADWSCCGFDPAQVPTTMVDWEDAPEAWASDALYVCAIAAGAE